MKNPFRKKCSPISAKLLCSSPKSLCHSGLHDLLVLEEIHKKPNQSTLNVLDVITLCYFLEGRTLKYKFCFIKVLHSEQAGKSATVNFIC